jgi:chromosome segregation protein
MAFPCEPIRLYFPLVTRSLGRYFPRYKFMYLQSLELIGFKSFAHKTVLNFHRGVTAIVGPNGCGKSNVLDAIRWVLGEQSAKALRGGEMADVIFSGTDSKQAVGMAEVSLTFSECEKELGTEYNEVRISRRVFRDGRSDYLLNKTPCRLKDIQMLFMDTGIGRTAYSIMEQGKIDLILSSRPEDRRAIFEEAAGITKYKAQKKEALRKLEYTDANLVRLTDIMKEVKRQIGSLQRQAGKAKRYKALFDDLRTLDTHFSFKSHNEIQESIGLTEKETERLRGVQRSLEEQVESQEFGLSEQRQQLELLEERIITARQRVQEIRNQVSAASSRIGFNEERILEAKTLSDRYQADIAAAEEKLSVQQSQLEETDQQLSEIFATLRTEEEQLRLQQTEANALRSQRQELERSSQEFQRQIQQRESRLATLRGDLSSMLNQREAGETRLELLQKDIAQTEATREHLAAQVADARVQLDDAQNRVQSCREQLKDGEHEQENKQREHQQTERELSANQRTLAERESKLEVLKQLNEEGAGLGAGTQAVLKGLDNPQLFRAATLGALANFVEVRGEYIAAIEVALGQHLQTIFISDQTVAEAIAKNLGEKKIGRAALIPTSFVSTHRAVQMQSLPDRALAWALDQIKLQPQVAPLVNRLLEHVVLAPDLAAAFEIKQSSPDLAIATVAGEYISRDGVVFAGIGGDNGSSILQRKIQIQQLETESQALRITVSQSEAKREELALDLEAMRAQVNELRDALQRAQVHASSLQGQLSLLDRELRDAEGKFKSLDWERNNVQQRLDSTSGKTDALEQELAATSVQLGEFQGGLSAALAEIDSIRSNEESLLESLNELKVRVATERQRQENLQRQRQPMTGRMAELRELIATRESDIANYAGKIEHLRDESESLRSTIAELGTEQVSAETEVSQLQQERSEHVASLEAVEANLRQVRKQHFDCQETRNHQEIKSTQLNLRLEHLREHANRRYQLELSTFAPDWYAFQVAIRDQRNRLEVNEPAHSEESNSEIDWDFAQTAIAEMTERLDAMGPVNLEAIQEYDELEERQRFLDEQNNDLVKSKNELLEVINKINATTEQLFADTFEQVRVNFQEMFTELFGGGKANLLLVDDSDPLESGIEIIAKPPGKQLQSISLLSGGEKTMTAVALLFSIYMVKPSPFCVLDEMDAPLDESNISRFIRILDRFVNQSQFVVITHNKRTISKADILYGVTMEEHGISKLVGVKLSKRDGAGSVIESHDNPEIIPSIAESFGKAG